MTFIASLLSKIRRVLCHPMVNDAGVFAFSQYIATGLGFFATIVTARILGPADYGALTLVMTYPILIWSFVGVKSTSITTRYISSFRHIGRNEEIKSICKLGYGLDFFVSVVDLPPKHTPKLLDKLEDGYEVVCGWRKNRKDPLVIKLLSKIANLCRRLTLGEKLHDVNCSLRVYEREFLKSINLSGNMYYMLTAILAASGYKISEAEINHYPRKF